ncbi:MAG: hypothetical protein ACI9OJ_004273, partial [Myxococcota bacterium]
GDTGHQFFWGAATTEDQCKFGGEQRRMLWLHPPTRNGTRTLRFEKVPEGQLDFVYGLAETSQHDNIKLALRVNGTHVPIPPIKKRDELLSYPVGLHRKENVVAVEVTGPPSRWRHLCIDGILQKSN